MQFRSLEILDEDEKQGVFDLLKPSYTFIPENTVVIFEYIVPETKAMRIDMIADDIYGDVNRADFLLFFNNILNPLNIRGGDVIRYVSADLINRYEVETNAENEVQDVFINVDKAKRKDPNRRKFLEEKRALPPTVNESSFEQIRIEGDSIIIGGDIFNI